MFEDDDQGEVTVKIDGVSFTAEWELAGNMLTVRLPGYGWKSEHLNGLSPEWLARDLVRALVRQGKVA